MSFMIKLSVRYAATSLFPHDHLAKKSGGGMIHDRHMSGGSPRADSKDGSARYKIVLGAGIGVAVIFRSSY